MSDVKNPADELEREDAMPTEPADAGAEASPAPEPQPPEEGINLFDELIKARQAAEAARLEAKDYKDALQRKHAELLNYKKRATREQAELFQKGVHDALQALLPIIDDFDRAFENVPETVSDDPWLGGVSMIQRKFMTLLERYEVEAIDPTGDPFDPNWHEAILTEASEEVESGYVIETLQKGFRAGNVALRPALVKVAS